MQKSSSGIPRGAHGQTFLDHIALYFYLVAVVGNFLNFSGNLLKVLTAIAGTLFLDLNSQYLEFDILSPYFGTDNFDPGF